MCQVLLYCGDVLAWAALPTGWLAAAAAGAQANDERALSRLLNCAFFAGATEPSSFILVSLAISLLTKSGAPCTWEGTQQGRGEV